MVERKVSEQLIAESCSSMDKKSVAVSPDCRRVAYIARSGEKRLVIVDGQEQKEYDRIERDSLLFSPDSQQVAYVVREGRKWFVVVDEEERKHYDGIREGSLVLSPDGQRIAYVAWQGSKQFLVVDGREQQKHDTVSGLVFSPNSQRLAYEVRVQDGMEDPEIAPPIHGYVVVDGETGVDYDRGVREGSLVFSPDSQRLAYVAAKRIPFLFLFSMEEEFVVVDGQEQKQYDIINHRSLVFSPNSQRLAYSGDFGVQVVDMTGGEVHHQSSHQQRHPVFSPNSQRMALLGDAGAHVIELNGQEVPHEDACPMPLVSSPNSQRAENEVEHYSAHSPHFVFSPDGQRLAYVALGYETGKQYVVVDGQGRNHFGNLEKTTLVFSPDSQRLAYITEEYSGFFWHRKVHQVVVDDLEGTKYDQIVAPPGCGSIIFDSPDQFHYIVRKGRDFYLVEERLF